MLKVVGASWMKIRMSTWIIGIVFLLGIVVVIVGQMGHIEEDGNFSATAYWSEESGFQIKFWGQGLNIHKIPKGVARAYFQPHIDSTGWAIIDIKTESSFPDWVQAYSAGLLEGSLTWQLIYWQWKNTVQNTCQKKKKFCKYVKLYLQENLRAVTKMIDENSEDPFWYQVNLFYTQLEGIKQGFEQGVKRSKQNIEALKLEEFLWMNAVSDVVDLEYKYSNFEQNSDEGSLSNSSQLNDFVSNSVLLSKIRQLRSVNGYSVENINNGNKDDVLYKGCGVSVGSAFVKIVPEEKNLYIAHNSAGQYVSMLKMIKRYKLKYRLSATDFWILDKKISFSSYPGAIHSMDDFYIISSKNTHSDLVITGTPITVLNSDIWQKTTPTSQVLSGPRTIAASRLSKNGQEWGSTLSRYNSGTGNKQWLIIDVRKFMNISSSPIEDEAAYLAELSDAKDILWVAEQVPGLFESQDQTKIFVNQTYWASYGLPYYQKIADVTGVYEVKKDIFSYENSPFAKIFRRDHEKAHSIVNIMKLMRSNKYQNDPLSLGNPLCAIGSRGDIPNQSSNSFPIGVIDSKVYYVGRDYDDNEHNKTDDAIKNHKTHSHKFQKDRKILQVIAGPPNYKDCSNEDEPRICQENSELKPFDWSIFSEYPHNGQPQAWEFEPISLAL